MERYALTDRKDIVAKLDYVDGASCLVLRPLVESIGLYDERFFRFYEDVEYRIARPQGRISAQLGARELWCGTGLPIPEPSPPCWP